MADDNRTFVYVVQRPRTYDIDVCENLDVAHALIKKIIRRTVVNERSKLGAAASQMSTLLRNNDINALVKLWNEVLPLEHITYAMHEVQKEKK